MRTVLRHLRKHHLARLIGAAAVALYLVGFLMMVAGAAALGLLVALLAAMAWVLAMIMQLWQSWMIVRKGGDEV